MKKIDATQPTGEVTVTTEADGTFIVRIGGQPYLRMPTQRLADQRADAIRAYDAAQRKN
jgi:hypothetical protein